MGSLTTSRPSRLESVGRAIAISAVLVGTLAACGWIFDLQFLRDVYEGLPATRMNEAVAMLLAGLSVWTTGGERTRRERAVAIGSAASVFAIGVVTLTEHIGSTLLEIDRLFYHSHGVSSGLIADRMTPPSAFGFAFVGLALLLLNLTRAAYAAHFAGSVASLIGQFALTGYGLAASNLYTSGSYGGMSVEVATILAVLGFAVLCVKPKTGLMAVLSSPNVGGIVARRLLPIGLGFLPLLAALSKLVQFLGLAKLQFGTPIILLLLILLLALPILWTSVLLYRTDNLRREAEERLVSQYALTEQLNQDLRRHAERVEEVNKELEAFSYSVSHDLRAPLRHIAGYVQLLEKRIGPSLDERSNHYLGVIAASSKQMGMLIDDLLSFSRMSRSEMLTRPIELNGLVPQVIEELTRSGGDRPIDWRIGQLPDVTGDPSMIRLVLVNHISNALKFTQTRSPAEIEIGAIDKAGEDVTIFIKDNGVGFDMNYADKLFGVFQRLHRADEFEGTGIGLATVRRIIDRHGGKTWAESVLDQGATFYFSLPKRQFAISQSPIEVKTASLL